MELPYIYNNQERSVYGVGLKLFKLLFEVNVIIDLPNTLHSIYITHRLVDLPHSLIMDGGKNED